jgi:hypothetical protein
MRPHGLNALVIHSYFSKSLFNHIFKIIYFKRLVQELESPIRSNNVQVFVSGCDNSTSDKCLLEIGTNQTITIKFSEYCHFIITLKVIQFYRLAHQFRPQVLKLLHLLP